jgi:hypothetical protein
MKHIVVAATAAVALASASLTAVAQQSDEERQRPQMQGQQPPSTTPKKGKDEREPSAKSEKKSDNKSTADEKSEAPNKGTAERKSDGPSKGTAERKDGAPSKGTAQKGDGGSKGTAEEKSETPTKGTAERKQDGAGKGTAAQKGDEAGDQKKGPSAAAKDGMDQGKAQDKSDRADLSSDQRTRVRTTIRQLNVRPVTNVNFSINAGVRIPRTVTLHTLPRTVVEIVPYYRGYRYFVAGERIVIVDPATYEIVYVIDEGGPDSRTARLVLNGSQRQLLLSHVEFNRPGPDISLRLALGAEIPERVELMAFPDPVVSGIPEIRGYRYVIVDRSVAIVDPDTRDVVLVIDR